jgi:hypothetical protein
VTVVSSPEPDLAPSGEGTVVLDIGGGRGAAVLLTPDSLSGQEVEIRRVGEPWSGWHTGVRRRELRDGVCFAAVFGSLPHGDYQVRVRGSDSGPTVGIAVTGGAIVEITWPIS